MSHIVRDFFAIFGSHSVDMCAHGHIVLRPPTGFNCTNYYVIPRKPWLRCQVLDHT